jgi:hypothetical protein
LFEFTVKPPKNPAILRDFARQAVAFRRGFGGGFFRHCTVLLWIPLFEATAKTTSSGCGQFRDVTPIREYDRLFDQALRDHEAAVRLDPRTAENFFARGLTYYDRAWAVRQDTFGSPADERYWPLAAEDFTKAIELDGAREQAFDMRGSPANTSASTTVQSPTTPRCNSQTRGLAASDWLICIVNEGICG